MFVVHLADVFHTELPITESAHSQLGTFIQMVQTTSHPIVWIKTQHSLMQDQQLTRTI